ncbi:hypothetical protein [Noviherbaspirillum sp. UKPF54]|uniref:hypothetical protein n=1 Tax=Noviherbaspirillum sp. UKPF54 TaxID=2601898 RepID=UPI0011B16EE9|nr:hypothetical protein [Noviherbaspirillum sp. UKPF54]QDZ29793.1 hypothetical protein FAY22_18580 [Noviherbaspirillum sp. UKPF54]
MSILTIAFPAQAALPVAEAFAGTAISMARPLLGFSVLAALFVMFKPLLVGLLRAALLVVKPRRTLEERTARRTMQGVLMLNRLARDYEGTQPALAAELRAIAARGN